MTTIKNTIPGARTRAFVLTRGAIVLFAVFSAIAMVLYPGGTFRDRSTPGYRFFHNFLSDLGMPQGWGGGPNGIGSVLFITAELAMAAALVPFFAALLRVCSTGRGRTWARASALAGLAAIAGLIGAALLPADRFLDLHTQSALLVFRAVFVSALLLAVGVARDTRFTRPTARVTAVVAVLLGVYVALLEWGPGTRTETGLIVQVTAQKVAVAALLGWFYLLSRDAERVSNVRVMRDNERGV